MSLATFFHQSIPEVGETVILDENESQHARGPRRKRVGDDIQLIDGKGVLASAAIESVTKESISVSIQTRVTVPAPSPLIHVISALPKGDRQRNMVEMLIQLGVASITPLNCERSVVKPRSINRDRLHRVSIEACKQSHNPYLPEVREPVSPQQAANEYAKRDVLCVVAEPRAEPIKKLSNTTGEVAIFIGPEGGFTSEERSLLNGLGAKPVSLGNTLLRIETAAVVAVSVFRVGVA